ncbi:MAG: hypothetical protein OXG50_15305, partial [bacterium]|nr:hypothetical protein [bacterium]
MRRYPRAIVGAGVLLVAALLAAGCSDGTDAPSAEEPAPTTVQPEPEASIFQDCGQVYLCAELEVPADHNDPDAGTITL